MGKGLEGYQEVPVMSPSSCATVSILTWGFLLLLYLSTLGILNSWPLEDSSWPLC